MHHAELLSKVTTHHIFKRWQQLQYDTHPISLLLLCSLRYLGRGWCFDDTEETTGISKEVHRNFSTILLKSEICICISILLNIQRMFMKD